MANIGALRPNGVGDIAGDSTDAWGAGDFDIFLDAKVYTDVKSDDEEKGSDESQPPIRMVRGRQQRGSPMSGLQSGNAAVPGWNVAPSGSVHLATTQASAGAQSDPFDLTNRQK